MPELLDELDEELDEELDDELDEELDDELELLVSDVSSVPPQALNKIISVNNKP